MMLRKMFLALAVIGPLAATPVAADGHGALFVNLTSDESHRASMAMMFSKSMMDRKHPVTIWLNDRGVLLAAKGNAERFPDQQQALADLMAKGATVIVCPYCAKHYGVAEADLIAGAKVGNPELTSGLLFKDDTRTLTW
jgi:sulfur relay (sulfurtransferase) complex TusBCD TusD component (DsrE family)